MARIGIAITKSCAFRSSTQEFSNVYYYDGLAFQPSSTEGDALIDDVVTKEKTIHSSQVTFVRGKLWSQIGSKEQNNMISQKNLSGVGARTTIGSFDKERAYLFRLRAGNDSRGNPVYLRKWYHSCGAFSNQFSPGTTILDNSTGFSAAEKAFLVGSLPTIGVVDGGGHHGVLCAKGGRLPDAGATWQPHTFLEHHQLGDMWRGT